MKRSFCIILPLIILSLILTSVPTASAKKKISYEDYMYSALQYEKQGNLQPAISQYLRASKEAPSQAEPLAKVSILYLFTRNPKKAKVYAEAALAIDPKHVGAWTNLSAIHLARGEWTETLNAAIKGLAIEPGNAALLINKATAFFYLDVYDDAEKDLLKVLKKDPQNASANYNLACVYSKTNRSMAAVIALEKALKAKPALKAKASLDQDLKNIWDDKYFIDLMSK